MTKLLAFSFCCLAAAPAIAGEVSVPQGPARLGALQPHAAPSMIVPNAAQPVAGSAAAASAAAAAGTSASAEAPRPGAALQERIWSERVLPSAYFVAPTSYDRWRSLLGSVATFATMGRTFENDSDAMPAARQPYKMLHPFGSVLKVTYRGREGHPYTGVLAEREVPGLMRLSLALPPTSKAFVPGAALKLFVDGASSLNAVFLTAAGLEGQAPDRNFFAQAFTNVLPAPRTTATKIGAWLIGLFNKGNATRIPVDHFADVRSDGSAAAQPRAPYQLLLKPVAGLGNPSDTTKDFRDELAASVKPGPLFEVHAVETPGAAPVHIGDLHAASKPVASEYGDTGLFFRHRRVIAR